MSTSSAPSLIIDTNSREATDNGGHGPAPREGDLAWARLRPKEGTAREHKSVPNFQGKGKIHSIKVELNKEK